MWRYRHRKNRCECHGRGEDQIPLADARPGRRCRVASIEGGRNVCARMAAMGIYPGVEMEIICSGCHSPCLVKVHGGTLSLGQGVAEKIMVTSIV